MSGAETIAAVVARATRDPVPASEQELRQMRACAPLGRELTALYSLTSELELPEFTLFEPALFVDINSERAIFGVLADLTFFGADFGSGFYAVDTQDLVGLGEGAVVWMDRADAEADSLVPCGDSLADFLTALLDGEKPRKRPSLGETAARRLMDRLAHLPASIEPGPPLDPMAFVTAREEQGLVVPFVLADLLEQADGLWFSPERQIFHFAQMKPLPGINAVEIGRDARLGTLAVTLGGWQSLPADRMFAFKPPAPPEQGQLLGRTADVIGLWIEEAAR